MLKQRIICKLLVENGQLVKYKRFTESKRIAGDPVSTMKTMTDQVLDEFMICTLGDADPALVRAMTDEAYTPVTVAGGIRTLDQVKRLIQECGADKVVIKSLPLADAIAHKFGAQAVVWPVDYRGDCPVVDVPDCVGEVLLTSIDRDGTGAGYDLSALAMGWNVPVVVAGGCGRLAHVRDAFALGADAAAVSSMFFFSDKSPVKLRSWLVSEGCNVRAA